MIIFAQFDFNMTTEGRTAFAHVDRNVEQSAAQNRDQFALRLRILKMKSTQDSLLRAGKIVLNEFLVDPGSRVARALIELREESSRITEQRQLQDQK